ncbi:MAG: TIGR00282 family metallophosphoesterase [Micavibrio sp.]|nr:TIGR00282 family metallophosphoesterase [Micavibrio sp.]
MKILFIGDIYGRSGREALETHLPTLKEKLNPDAVIVNVDNASHGRGITDKHAEEFFSLGVDCLTGGDHVWDQRQIIAYIGRQPKLLRPINFSETVPGVGALKVRTDDGRTCLVIHALGRVFMNPMNDPFAAVNKIVETNKMGRDVDAIFVDFHAEATSEKMAMGHYLDGRVSAVVGTHTHIPTADNHIMKGGTAYQTDAGMCGDYDSVIGARKDIPLHKFVKGMPGERMIPANGDATLCGCLIETDDNNGRAKSIKPIRLGGVLAQELPI